MEKNENVHRGIRLAKEGFYTDALRVFDENLCFTQNPIAMSYYALSLAMVEGFYDKAVSLCLMAAEKEFYNPEIYLNLGRIFLLNGQKSVAIKSFRKGLRFDSSNPDLVEEVKRMGIRRRPPISFLARNNPVNKLIGMLIVRFV